MLIVLCTLIFASNQFKRLHSRQNWTLLATPLNNGYVLNLAILHLHFPFFPDLSNLNQKLGALLGKKSRGIHMNAQAQPAQNHHLILGPKRSDSKERFANPYPMTPIRDERPREKHPDNTPTTMESILQRPQTSSQPSHARHGSGPILAQTRPTGAKSVKETYNAASMSSHTATPRKAAALHIKRMFNRMSREEMWIRRDPSSPQTGKPLQFPPHCRSAQQCRTDAGRPHGIVISIQLCNRCPSCVSHS